MPEPQCVDGGRHVWVTEDGTPTMRVERCAICALGRLTLSQTGTPVIRYARNIAATDKRDVMSAPPEHFARCGVPVPQTARERAREAMKAAER